MIIKKGKYCSKHKNQYRIRIHKSYYNKKWEAISIVFGRYYMMVFKNKEIYNNWPSVSC